MFFLYSRLLGINSSFVTETRGSWGWADRIVNAIKALKVEAANNK
jgi:hypothetical protein